MDYTGTKMQVVIPPRQCRCKGGMTEGRHLLLKLGIFSSANTYVTRNVADSSEDLQSLRIGADNKRLGTKQAATAD